MAHSFGVFGIGGESGLISDPRITVLPFGCCCCVGASTLLVASPSLAPLLRGLKTPICSADSDPDAAAGSFSLSLSLSKVLVGAAASTNCARRGVPCTGDAAETNGC